VNRLHALEFTAVAIAGFLLGCAVRVDGDLIWRMLGQLLGI
jgi:hypothetical protein